jgi:hypothetical protein
VREVTSKIHLWFLVRAIGGIQVVVIWACVLVWRATIATHTWSGY